jgi:dinuclear metal center YbgI/SA1388 family protein
MKIKEITDFLERMVPLKLQESYDNSGLIVGDGSNEFTKALICLDCTEEIVEEALNKKCNLVISHHPLIFEGLKKINSNTHIGRSIIKAIKNELSLYAIHTNIDNHIEGLNSILARKLGLKNCTVLKPMKEVLKKIVTYCPVEHADKVRNAIFEAGAGHIGNYDSCSYNIIGEGTFKPLENANPYVGEISKLHFEKEIRIETVFPAYKQKEILEALFKNHPYEEVAYDIYPLNNEYKFAGAGMIGELEHETDTEIYLNKIKEITKAACLKYSKIYKKKIKKIAVCTGSGDFLIKNAGYAKADLFISSEIKYHSFIDVPKELIIVDAGHYETEQFIKELLYDILNKNFPNFAFLISEINSNPVNYL